MSKLTIISSKDMVKILEALGSTKYARKEVIKVLGIKMEELRWFPFTEKIWAGDSSGKY